MHVISIQIQPEHLAKFDRKRFLTQVRAVGRSPEIDEFEEKGTTYLTFHFFTEVPKSLWHDLQTALYKNTDYASVISPISIAAYENQDSDDDFLILHHFDPSEKIHSIK